MYKIAMASFIVAGCWLHMLDATPRVFKVRTNQGNQKLYGAVYYVQSHAAQRVGNIKNIDQEETFFLPAVVHKSNRCLIVSLEPRLLKEVFRQPLATPGIMLVTLTSMNDNEMVLDLNEQELQKLCAV